MDVFITIFTTLGAAVFLPIIFFIVGLCLRLKIKDAIISGMTLGIGFVGMGMLINFMFGYMQSTMVQFNDLTGMGLKGIDLGWSPLAAISWGFVWGLLFLPIQLGINILMISLKKTKTLNLDLWNIWNKIFLTIIVVSLLTAMGAEKYVAIPIAMVVGCIQIPFELMLGDAVQKTIFKVTKIPGITVPHCMGFFGAICWPIEFLLRKSKTLNKDFNAASLRKKIGIFADNGFIGLLIGFIIGLIAYWPIPGQPVQIYMALLVAIQTATALVLFPMVARLFMQALAPISTAVDSLMKKKFKGKELYIGLDWPVVAGSQELWSAMIIWVPFTLAYSIGIGYAISAFDTRLAPMLPLASIINTSLGPAILIVTKGNLIRMIILGLIVQPIFLIGGAWAGPVITDYINQNPEILNQFDENVQKYFRNGVTISSAGIEAIWYRFSLAYVALVVMPNTVDPIFQMKYSYIMGMGLWLTWLGLFIWYYKSLVKDGYNIAIEEKLMTQEDIDLEILKSKMKWNNFRKIFKKDLITIDGFNSLRKYEKNIEAKKKEQAELLVGEVKQDAK